MVVVVEGGEAGPLARRRVKRAYAKYSGRSKEIAALKTSFREMTDDRQTIGTKNASRTGFSARTFGKTTVRRWKTCVLKENGDRVENNIIVLIFFQASFFAESDRL